jgi:hypothetical protein
MKKYAFQLIAACLALILSSFTKDKSPVMKLSPHAFNTTYYFKYKSTTNFTGAGYRDASNWEARGFNPGSDSCPNGVDEKPCVISASLATGNSGVSYLMAFFNDMGSTAAVVDYVEDMSNIYYYQPGP